MIGGWWSELPEEAVQISNTLETAIETNMLE
jgi:hypothetical protein